MKKALLIFILIPILVNSQQGQKNFIDQNYIEVTGKIEIEIIPDEIYLSITINEKDKRKLSVEDQEKMMIKRLKEIGIDVDKKLTLKDFSGVYSKYFLKKDEVQKTKNYELLIHDTQQLPIIFKILDILEISNVFISKTDHSEIEKFRREAKIKSIRIAKEKAIDYASAIEQTIGKAIFIREDKLYSINSLTGSANGILIRGKSSNKFENNFQDIQLSKINITATVFVRFELK